MVQFSPSSDYGAIPKADSVARQIDRSKSRTLVFEEKIDKNDLWPYKTAKPAKFYNQKENEISGEAYLPNYRPKQVCSVGQKLIFGGYYLRSHSLQAVSPPWKWIEHLVRRHEKLP